MTIKFPRSHNAASIRAAAQNAEAPAKARLEFIADLYDGMKIDAASKKARIEARSGSYWATMFSEQGIAGLHQPRQLSSMSLVATESAQIRALAEKAESPVDRRRLFAVAAIRDGFHPLDVIKENKITLTTLISWVNDFNKIDRHALPEKRKAIRSPKERLARLSDDQKKWRIKTLEKLKDGLSAEARTRIDAVIGFLKGRSIAAVAKSLDVNPGTVNGLLGVYAASGGKAFADLPDDEELPEAARGRKQASVSSAPSQMDRRLSAIRSLAISDIERALSSAGGTYEKTVLKFLLDIRSVSSIEFQRDLAGGKPFDKSRPWYLNRNEFIAAVDAFLKGGSTGLKRMISNGDREVPDVELVRKRLALPPLSIGARSLDAIAEYLKLQAAASEYSEEDRIRLAAEKMHEGSPTAFRKFLIEFMAKRHSSLFDSRIPEREASIKKTGETTAPARNVPPKATKPSAAAPAIESRQAHTTMTPARASGNAVTTPKQRTAAEMKEEMIPEGLNVKLTSHYRDHALDKLQRHRLDLILTFMTGTSEATRRLYHSNEIHDALSLVRSGGLMGLVEDQNFVRMIQEELTPKTEAILKTMGKDFGGRVSRTARAVQEVKQGAYPVDAAEANDVSARDIVKLCEHLHRHRTSDMSGDPVSAGRGVVAVTDGRRLRDIDRGFPLWQSANHTPVEFLVFENEEQARTILEDVLEQDAEYARDAHDKVISMDDCTFIDVEIAPHFMEEGELFRVPGYALEAIGSPYPAVRPREDASTAFAPA